MNRRQFLASAASAAMAQTSEAPTKFQLACMTLPYSPFPLERALTGIRQAGYDFVAWGVNHTDASGTRRPALAVDALPAEAATLAQRCRGMGLEPVMMFSTVHLEGDEALDPHLRRIDQAAAAKIPFLLTFGKTERGQYETVIRNLQKMGPRAQAAGVTVVIKQHGGNSATGAACSRIIAEVGQPAVRMCYDAGNVLDYENQDPIADVRTCWRDIRAFAIKDHRNWPRDQDCGPGFGEIDHYKLLQPVMKTGLTMPLAFENIFEPMIGRPKTADGVDALARRARAYVHAVLRGLATV